jgi:hypothetical protein
LYEVFEFLRRHRRGEGHSLNRNPASKASSASPVIVAHGLRLCHVTQGVPCLQLNVLAILGRNCSADIKYLQRTNRMSSMKSFILWNLSTEEVCRSKPRTKKYTAAVVERVGLFTPSDGLIQSNV